MKTPVYSFAPVSDVESRVLILGSMPGKASLNANEYYAHPRNAFWRIIAALAGVAPDLSYASKIALLKHSRIALWDVLMSCIRESSLDADIEEASIRPNDFLSFCSAHPNLECVFFNGVHAESSYRKYVLPLLGSEFGYLKYQRLPSTSPAHASLSYEQKLAAWRHVMRVQSCDYAQASQAGS